MNISEFKNEDALDLLVRCIDPFQKIAADKKVLSLVKENKNKLEIVTYVIRNHKAEVIELLAALDGVSVDKYNHSLPHMIKQVMDVVNDKELAAFFTLSEPRTE